MSVVKRALSKTSALREASTKCLSVSALNFLAQGWFVRRGLPTLSI